MALGIGAAILGGSLISGAMGNKAADKAASASAKATKAGIKEQARQFDIGQMNSAPYLYYGQNALGQLGGYLGIPEYQSTVSNPQSAISQAQPVNVNGIPEYQQPVAAGGVAPPSNGLHRQQLPAGGVVPPSNSLVTTSPQGSTINNPEGNLPTFNYTGENLPGQFSFDLQTDPGYQFARDEALKATTRQLASQGKFNSGNILAALNDRAVGMASQYTNDAYNRQLSTYGTNYGRAQDIYNRDLGQYGLNYQRAQDVYGREQTQLNWLASLAGIGQNAVNSTSNLGANMANSIGNLQMANAANQGSAAGYRANSINNAVQGGMSNYLGYLQNQNLMNALNQNQYSNYGPYQSGYQWG